MRRRAARVSGLTRVRAGQLAPALADCNQSLSLRPNDPASLETRAFVYLRMKNPEFAIADYNSALTIDPRSAASFYGRGLARQMAGDPSEAAKDIAAAKMYEPGIDAQFAKWGITPQ